MVARQLSVNGQIYSPKCISKNKKEIKPNKDTVQVCSDTSIWNNTRPLFLCPKFVYEAYRGQGQTWTPTFQTMTELIVGWIR